MDKCMRCGSTEELWEIMAEDANGNIHTHLYCHEHLKKALDEYYFPGTLESHVFKSIHVGLRRDQLTIRKNAEIMTQHLRKCRAVF